METKIYRVTFSDGSWINAELSSDRTLAVAEAKREFGQIGPDGDDVKHVEPLAPDHPASIRLSAAQVLAEGPSGYTYALPATHARQVMIQANRARSAELRNRQWSPTALNALAFHSFALSMDKDGDALVRAALSRYENEQSRAWCIFPLNPRDLWRYAYACARTAARRASLSVD